MTQTPPRVAGLKPDEVALWNLFGEGKLFQHLREAYQFLQMPDRRAYYLACKWSDKHVFDWGTSWSLGWKEYAVDDRIRNEVSVPGLPILDINIFRWDERTKVVRRIYPLKLCLELRVHLAHNYIQGGVFYRCPGGGIK